MQGPTKDQMQAQAEEIALLKAELRVSELAKAKPLGPSSVTWVSALNMLSSALQVQPLTSCFAGCAGRTRVGPQMHRLGEADSCLHTGEAP